MSARRRLAVVVTVAALAAAACSGGGKKDKTLTQPLLSPDPAIPLDTSTTAPPADDNPTSTTGISGQAVSTTTTKPSNKATTSTNARPRTSTTLAKPQNQLQTTTTAPGTVAEPPRAGGTLTVLLASEGNGFDPTKGTGNAASGDMQRMFAVYDMLIYQDPRSGNLVPEIAQAMTSADARVWTMKLRPNVKFSDGTIYDAAAVRTNWDRQADPANASPWALTFKTLTYRIVDPLTIEITLNTPNSQFPRIVSRQLGFIASPTALQAAGSQDAYNSGKPIGAGAFLLQTWARDSQMTLVRNPMYWNSPRPYLDSLVFRVITDPVQREAALKAGTGDVSTATPTSSVELSKSFSMVVSPAVTTTGFVMQQGHAPFSDKSLRRAMVLAIDVDEYNKVIGQNAYETAHSIFPTNYPYADPAIVLPKPDLVQAQKLVDDYVNTRNSGRDIEFSYSYVTTAPQAEQAAQLVQNQLQRLNHVHVTLKPVTSGQLVANLVAGDFDAGTLTYSGVDPEPEFTEAVVCKGSRNFYDYCNPAVDQAVTESRTTLDAASRVQSLKTVQRLIIDDVFFVPLAHGGSMFAAKASVKDVATFDDGGLLTDRIWLKT